MHAAKHAAKLRRVMLPLSTMVRVSVASVEGGGAVAGGAEGGCIGATWQVPLPPAGSTPSKWTAHACAKCGKGQLKAFESAPWPQIQTGDPCARH